MGKRGAFEKALRAAQTVVRGTGRHATHTAAGVLLATLPGCLSTESGTATSAGGTETTANDVIAEVKELVWDAIGQETSSTDASGPQSDGATMEVSDVTVPSDDGHVSNTDDGHVPDAPVETDVFACIESCFQPIDKPCSTYQDCEVPEPIPGSCSVTEVACTPSEPCPEGESCEGYEEVVFAYVEESGEVAPWSPINCLDGMCHVGDWNSASAQACCADFESWCEGVNPAGCSPWGPPAPPSMAMTGRGVA